MHRLARQPQMALPLLVVVLLALLGFATAECPTTILDFCGDGSEVYIPAIVAPEDFCPCRVFNGSLYLGSGPAGYVGTPVNLTGMEVVTGDFYLGVDSVSRNIVLPDLREVGGFFYFLGGPDTLSAFPALYRINGTLTIQPLIGQPFNSSCGIDTLKHVGGDFAFGLSQYTMGCTSLGNMQLETIGGALYFRNSDSESPELTSSSAAFASVSTLSTLTLNGRDVHMLAFTNLNTIRTDLLFDMHFADAGTVSFPSLTQVGGDITHDVAVGVVSTEIVMLVLSRVNGSFNLPVTTGHYTLMALNYVGGDFTVPMALGDGTASSLDTPVQTVGGRFIMPSGLSVDSFYVYSPQLQYIGSSIVPPQLLTSVHMPELLQLNGTLNLQVIDLSLPKLDRVNGALHLDALNQPDLSLLRIVSGDLYVNAPIPSLGHLESVGGSLTLTSSTGDVNCGKLKFIGGDASIEAHSVTQANFTSLAVVQGTLTIGPMTVSTSGSVSLHFGSLRNISLNPLAAPENPGLFVHDIPSGTYFLRTVQLVKYGDVIVTGMFNELACNSSEIPFPTSAIAHGAFYAWGNDVGSHLCTACHTTTTVMKQAHVNALNGCKVINGSLILNITTPLNLNPLKSIREIQGGMLVLHGSAMGSTLDFLSGLLAVDGEVIIAGTSLVSLSAMRLRSVRYGFSISENYHLTDFDMLADVPVPLRDWGYAPQRLADPARQSVYAFPFENGLPFLAQLNYAVIIRHNPKVTSFGTLDRFHAESESLPLVYINGNGFCASSWYFAVSLPSATSDDPCSSFTEPCVSSCEEISEVDYQNQCVTPEEFSEGVDFALFATVDRWVGCNQLTTDADFTPELVSLVDELVPNYNALQDFIKLRDLTVYGAVTPLRFNKLEDVEVLTVWLEDCASYEFPNLTSANSIILQYSENGGCNISGLSTIVTVSDTITVKEIYSGNTFNVLANLAPTENSESVITVQNVAVQSLRGFDHASGWGIYLKSSDLGEVHICTQAQNLGDFVVEESTVTAFTGFGNALTANSISITDLTMDCLSNPFPSLAQVQGSITLQANNWADNCTVLFPELTVVGDYVSLQNNNLQNFVAPRLGQITGNNLIECASYSSTALCIASNTHMQNLGGFYRMAEAVGAITVVLNPNLCVGWASQSGLAPSGTVNAADNSASCSELSGDQHVSSFADLLSLVGYNYINGGLRITLDADVDTADFYLPSLTLLNNGELFISGVRTPTIDFLPALDSIKSYVVKNNPGLVDLSLSISTFVVSVDIDNNPLLETISAFPSSVSGETTSDSPYRISVTNNPRLESYDFLSQLTNYSPVPLQPARLQNNSLLCADDIVHPVAGESVPLDITFVNDSCSNDHFVNQILTVVPINSPTGAGKFMRAMDTVLSMMQSNSGSVANSSAVVTSMLSSMANLATYLLNTGSLPSTMTVNNITQNMDKLFSSNLMQVARSTGQSANLAQSIESIFFVASSSVASGCGQLAIDYHGSNFGVQGRQASSSDSSSAFQWAGIDLNLPTDLAEHVGFNSTGDATGCLSQLFVVYKNSPFVGTSDSVSSVFSFSLRDTPIVDLTSPIRFTMEVDLSSGMSPSKLVCAFWNYTLNNWDTNGCVSANATATSIDCACTHATNFAILFDISGGDDISEESKLALRYLSAIGCALSVAGCVFTLIVFMLLPKLRTGPVVLVMGLCVAILAVNILFLVGMSESSNLSSSGCEAVAALLHLFLMASFFLMFCQGVHMYLLVVRLARDTDHYIKRYIVGSYGLAILIVVCLVIANAGTDPYRVVDYGGQDSDVGHACWIGNRNGLIGAFVVPVGVILGINLLIFGAVLYNLHAVQNDKSLKGAKSQSNQTRLYLTILSLFGLTWIFAYVAYIRGAEFAWYLFVILNSFQGAIIFFFYCCNRRVLDNLRQRFGSGSYAAMSSGQSKSTRATSDDLESARTSRATQSSISESGTYEMTSR
ncbi:hypothetical protein CAOG_00812 [Capsaspora owczarzaki ATCC 30864]|uniref:G-protein coupled receptors family 2 profile 2 domain-containing protein n=1 Tax=Capsaspora owczarzaki (strain ATCC 30864) TaxID=595528 RepID=A0A0D2VH93_CAPO3|nr:hypothetical protein CAOG_00812 [Capsaspora owczarzaki ATCC 30864]KJE89316.1 hypothetical protein CAOG_000812 [Capsaspora owczarzaki ATCC 30864]KJE89317.1 hypothetical protein, variant [Capsaspora owczarzaki ATCC 30864]|eukprot:XP_004365683.1 hypothetical protein CAOG_00812 [Capsaspora owczarzaki ATCC 30864]